MLGFTALWLVDHTNIARYPIARRALSAIPKVALFFFLIRGSWPSLPLSWQIGLAFGCVLVYNARAFEFTRLSRRK